MTGTAQAPTPPPRPRRARTATVGGAAALALAATAVLGVHGAAGSATAVRWLPAAAGQPLVDPAARYGRTPGGEGSATSSTSTVPAAGQATAAQLVGVVDIETVLGYQGAEAAGTGMVLTADGEVLTNNHVVRGATAITVRVLSTGATYRATVVGTDPTDDVAVLQLTGAGGLAPARIDQRAVAVGDPVTAVGNAGNEPGTAAATGAVTALDQSITATDSNGSDAEDLTGLIGIAADVQAGDSGGPLYDAAGRVVGMDTAASGSGGQAYAIPISSALSVAAQITGGIADRTIHQGVPAFLGVSVLPTASTSGASVAGVVPGGPADSAGLAAGDVITGIGGTTVTSADHVTAALAGHSPGDRVTVTWADGSGAAHSATVTLAAGPAD